MPALATDLRAALAAATTRLAEAGCDTPRLDAELLLADALGVGREWLFANSTTDVSRSIATRFERSVARREAREPVAYILCRRHFRRLDLVVNRDVLIPRPETELLVEVGLELAPGACVHDVGTGSGAVALALKAERPDLEVSASDISPRAVDVARENARRHRLDVELSVAAGLPGGAYELVVANLPYVREDEWGELAPEIRAYEPRTALVAGADGLDAIRALIGAAPPGTRLALEHAPAQAEAVRSMLDAATSRPDLTGRARVTIGYA